jgi:hypothetical protein
MYPFISLIAFVIGIFSSVRGIVCGNIVMIHDNGKAKYEKTVFIKHFQNLYTSTESAQSV